MHGGSEQLHEVQDTTSTDLISLEPHTEYTVRVRAKTVHFGDYSITVSRNSDPCKNLDKLVRNVFSVDTS